MYELFNRHSTAIGERFTFAAVTNLFGCRVGKIPSLLLRQTAAAQDEPYAWHIDIRRALTGPDGPSQSLIISLKPRNSRPNLSLYEVLDVWGYSANGWTPAMLRLRGLYIDEDPAVVANPADFEIELTKNDVPIYSMLYLDGSISKGKLTGRWTAPRASSTNSVLLWPEALSYFFAMIQDRTPGVLTADWR